MKAPSLKPLVQCGVVAVGDGFESLPASEQETILASQSEAWRRLALTRSRYNAIKAQKSPDTPFDAEDYILVASHGHCLPRDAILRALEDCDKEFFIRLGKSLQAIQKRQTNEEKPKKESWGSWLVDYWVNQQSSPVPSLCMVTPAVLAEVMGQCSGGSIGTGSIEKRIRDLGLKRSKGLKLAACGRYPGERLRILATSHEELKRYARSKGRRPIEIIV